MKKKSTNQAHTPLVILAFRFDKHVMTFAIISPVQRCNYTIKLQRLVSQIFIFLNSQSKIPSQNQLLLMNTSLLISIMKLLLEV